MTVNYNLLSPFVMNLIKCRSENKYMVINVCYIYTQVCTHKMHRIDHCLKCDVQRIII